jgi:hypothetical protein
MKLAIIAVLVVIAYIICNAVSRISNARQEAKERERTLNAQCQDICRGLAQIDQQRKEFEARTSHLDEAERKWLWSAVVDRKVLACNMMAAREFARASAYLLQAKEKAAGLIAQYQGA